MKKISNTNLGKLLIGALWALAPLGILAQEAETKPKFDFSGSVDAYYRANLTAPNDEDAIAPGSSFAQLPGFALGMANLIASYEAAKVGVVADLVFGPRGSGAIFASPMCSAAGQIGNP